jgi:hypothetical protein
MKIKSTYEKIMRDIKQRGEKATIDTLMVFVVIPTKKMVTKVMEFVVACIKGTTIQRIQLGMVVKIKPK